MVEIDELLRISRYAGMRFDLVQAGGGNTSVKLPDGLLKVKASGFHLSQMCAEKGIATLHGRSLADFVEGFDPRGLSKERVAAAGAEALAAANPDPSTRPSIESFLHAITPGAYTLHTHPLAVAAISSRPDWESEIASRLPAALLVPYSTPGLELAMRLRDELAASAPVGAAVLRNHGLIVWGDSVAAVVAAQEEVCGELSSCAGLDETPFRLQTELWEILRGRGADLLVHLSNDADLAAVVSAHPEYLDLPPAYPDVLVYCGAAVPRLRDAAEFRSLLDAGGIPKAVLLRGRIYVLASSLAKARETEELLRFSMLSARANAGKQVFLPEAELEFLGNWESEKWRERS